MTVCGTRSNRILPQWVWNRQVTYNHLIVQLDIYIYIYTYIQRYIHTYVHTCMYVCYYSILHVYCYYHYTYIQHIYSDVYVRMGYSQFLFGSCIRRFTTHHLETSEIRMNGLFGGPQEETLGGACQRTIGDDGHHWPHGLDGTTRFTSRT